VKKAVFVFALFSSLALLLCSCVSIRRPPVAPINWPAEIKHMEAVCEINMSWKGLRYSGEMSINLDYPETLALDVYGPFGDTVVSIRKDKDRFSMKVDNDEISDKDRFRSLFNMNIDDFIDDVAMRGAKEHKDGLTYVQRDRYRVEYERNQPENKMCWIGSEGSICVRFLEAIFEKGQDWKK